jgi:hypothetical protein
MVWCGVVQCGVVWSGSTNDNGLEDRISSLSQSNNKNMEIIMNRK